VNKAQLVDAVAERLGDTRTAAAAVDGMVDVIVRTVAEDESVTIPGFGVFEKRARAARTARNPRTGETVQVAETAVPAFRPGSTFKGVIAGTKELSKAAATTVAGTGRSNGTAVANGSGRARATSSGSSKKAPAGTDRAAKSAAKTAEARKAAEARKTAAAKAAGKKGTARKK
jgi:DNA-binding protein HU-beta